MADRIPVFEPNTDPYSFMGFVRSLDGSVTRIMGVEPPKTSITSCSSNSFLLVKDIPANQFNNTWVRVFLPRETVESSPDGTKLPLIIFFHGGGFIILNADSTVFDEFYTTLTIGIPSIFVSVEYRLAPEHRLPAAYDDGMEVLHLIKNCQDELLKKYADFSNSFIMGSSAGGNIAYHVGLRAASCSDDLKPLNIKGLILHQPFFGGTQRTQSELRSVNDKVLPLCVADVMWELGLPIGVDRDHQYCNPIVAAKSDKFDQIKALYWKILVTGYDHDPLIDRQIEFVKMLEEKGVVVVNKLNEVGYHGIEILEPSKNKLLLLCKSLKEFVTSFITATA